MFNNACWLTGKVNKKENTANLSSRMTCYVRKKSHCPSSHRIKPRQCSSQNNCQIQIGDQTDWIYMQVQELQTLQPYPLINVWVVRSSRKWDAWWQLMTSPWATWGIEQWGTSCYKGDHAKVQRINWWPYHERGVVQGDVERAREIISEVWWIMFWLSHRRNGHYEVFQQWRN